LGDELDECNVDGSIGGREEQDLLVGRPPEKLNCQTGEGERFSRTRRPPQKSGPGWGATRQDGGYLAGIRVDGWRARSPRRFEHGIPQSWKFWQSTKLLAELVEKEAAIDPQDGWQIRREDLCVEGNV
jgi:hypothetical protein